MLNMIDQCERYMAWIKHYASKLAYLLWLTPSGQVAHATLDRRLCRTRIFTMQVADRFHLHQNLLEAIKKALNKEIPATINIPHADEEACKKSQLMWITFQIIQKNVIK